jgi:hypothetical protein
MIDVKRHRFTNSTGTINIRDSESGGRYKSKLEKYAFIRTFLGPDVISVHLQQPRIKYVDATGEPRRYTGDLLVQFHERAKRRPLVIECKYARKLKSDPGLAKKHQRVAATLDRQGRDFVVHTEHDVQTSDFRMMRFVFDHVNNDPHPASQEILGCLATHRSLSLEQLLNALRSDLLSQCALIPEVWRLVARHRLSVNFQESLDRSAKISLPSV